MPNLVIDIGNTLVKAAVFENNRIIDLQKHTQIQTDLIEQLIKSYQIKNLIVSSVTNDTGFDEVQVSNQVNYHRFSKQSKHSITNQYKTPQTLGLDRLAAVIGANTLYPKHHVLVMDAGTCITYDSVTPQAEYFGGSISPGIKMRFEAMNHFTSKLPLVNFNSDFSAAYGDDTITAISSGAINGAVYEAEGFFKQYIKKYKDAKIILCGGDSAFFDTKFKNSIFAHSILHEPNLVLIGLNTVVNYQYDFK